MRQKQGALTWPLQPGPALHNHPPAPAHLLCNLQLWRTPALRCMQMVGPIGSEEAAVVCRDLGLSGGRGLSGGAVGQEGVQPPVLTDLSCTSREAALADCFFKNATSATSFEGKDTVGVACELPSGESMASGGGEGAEVARFA